MTLPPVFNRCRLVVASAACATFTACGGNSSGPPATEVSAWNAFASELVAANQPPPIQTHTLAVVQIAVHDALNAVEPRYRPYRPVALAPGASSSAAVAAAAHATLVRLLPGAAPAVTARYDAALASIPDGSAKESGVASGRAAAAAILALRSGDDLFGALGKTYTPRPAGPGVYQPTPPSGIVVGAGYGEVAPFAMTAGSQFRSAAPFAVTGSDYARDFAEVRDLGRADSALRSADQTQTARFWYDAATREWHQAARQGLAAARADEWQAARALALLGIAMADGVIASMETKFAHDFWRPVTAIRAGDADGNDATTGDASWEPLCATPPFPDHNSTHAVTASAAAGVLARLIGDGHAFSIDSPTLAGASRTYGRFSDAAHEAGMSRIYCGIHFRNAMDAGLAQGESIAKHVVGTLLQPVGAVE